MILQYLTTDISLYFYFLVAVVNDDEYSKQL